ncbi:hypothetical protein [Desulfobacula sp.]|uniref:LPP20 family lipoprotein n=1 Tax=Desulfobacula sp. TaxID=2593537 RepID=UPI00260632F2|nr:hypothetical protein [Desulfobacula sp.]
MKKLSMIVCGVLALGVVFSGCSGVNLSSKAGGPGNVLGPPSGEVEDQKVVSFMVVGKGLEPENALSKGEAVLMAERAAVADGYRQLVEKVRGVYVDAFMRAGRGTINYDTIQVHTQSWLRGTEIMEIYPGDHGITHARLRLRINFDKDGMVWWPVGIGGNMTSSSGKSLASGSSER